MKLQAPIPVLRIFDHQMARAFYCDWLGFAVDWEHQLLMRGIEHEWRSRPDLYASETESVLTTRARQ